MRFSRAFTMVAAQVAMVSLSSTGNSRTPQTIKDA